jgi:hypothetical protein
VPKSKALKADVRGNGSAMISPGPVTGITMEVGAMAAGQAPPQWIHIFPLGEWTWGQGQDRWVITAATCQDFVANFRANVLGRAIPLDCDHQVGQAPGWLADMEARADGLWARVEWTSLGAELLADRRYRYVSPEWYWKYKSPTSQADYANVLSALALTNKPKFSQLPAIAQEGIPMPEQAPVTTTETTAVPPVTPPAVLPIAPVATAGPVDPETAALRARIEQMETRECEMAARDQERAAEMAAIRYREQRAICAAELSRPGLFGDPAVFMPPVLVEHWASRLAMATDTQRPVQASETGDAQGQTTDRAQLMADIVATAQAFPRNREFGMNLRPGQALAAEGPERGAQLDAMARERMKTMTQMAGEAEMDWYQRAVEAVLEETGANLRPAASR